ncbi:MAG: hypothetical protein HY064_15640 [Bacteroidetes bacterium]|nr:hypothetical protein [Bacteroidota bacterium]
MNQDQQGGFGNYNYNYNNPYQPPFNPPPKKNNRAIIWITCGLIFAGLLALLIVNVMKAGKKFGDKIGQATTSIDQMMDSLNDNSNDESYKAAYAELGDNAVDRKIRAKLDELKSATEEIIKKIKTMQEEFHDTLHDAQASILNMGIAREFFIESGRATQLKINIEKYRDNMCLLADPSNNINAKMWLDLDNDNSKDPFNHYKTWEEKEFRQAPTAALANLAGLKSEIHSFEGTLISELQSKIQGNSLSDTMGGH